jgi:hypothetical protein
LRLHPTYFVVVAVGTSLLDSSEGIRTSFGGKVGDDGGGCSRSSPPSRLVVAETTTTFSETVFNESIAAIAACSSATSGSSRSLLSSEGTLAIVLEGEELGDTTKDDADVVGPLLEDLCASSKDRCDSKETQL